MFFAEYVVSVHVAVVVVFGVDFVVADDVVDVVCAIDVVVVVVVVVVVFVVCDDVDGRYFLSNLFFLCLHLAPKLRQKSILASALQEFYQFILRVCKVDSKL